MVDLPRAEAAASIRHIGEQSKRITEALDDLFSELLNGTTYHTIDDLVTHIKRRFQGKVDGNELPFHQLQSWINTSKQFQAKILLAHKQGLVCNRCDGLMYSIDQLTVDHITPDRSRSQLTNLQLLCKRCNQDKADNHPDQRDISPFNYEGEPCVHRITCVELEHLRRSYESTRETIGHGSGRQG